MIPLLPKGWTWERGPGRVCRDCQAWTPWTELKVDKPSSLGRRALCRSCGVARNRRRRRSDPAIREAEAACRRRYREAHPEAERERERARAGTCQSCGEPCSRGSDFCRPCADAHLPGWYSLGVLVQNPEAALAPGRLYLVRLPFGLKYGITRAVGAREREARYRSGVVVRQVETTTLFEAWTVEQAVKARQDLHRPTTEEEMEGMSGRTEVLWDTPEAEAFVQRAMDALEGRQEALLDLAFELALATYEEAALGYYEDRWGVDD